MIFPCNKCGICCMNVDKAGETRHLDRGDGTCVHFSGSEGCAIYETRPDICRVDRQYELRFSAMYTWEEFVTVNAGVCVELQRRSSSEPPRPGL